MAGAPLPAPRLPLLIACPVSVCLYSPLLLSISSTESVNVRVLPPCWIDALSLSCAVHCCAVASPALPLASRGPPSPRAPAARRPARLGEGGRAHRLHRTIQADAALDGGAAGDEVLAGRVVQHGRQVRVAQAAGANAAGVARKVGRRRRRRRTAVHAQRQASMHVHVHAPGEQLLGALVLCFQGVHQKVRNLERGDGRPPGVRWQLAVHKAAADGRVLAVQQPGGAQQLRQSKDGGWAGSGRGGLHRQAAWRRLLQPPPPSTGCDSQHQPAAPPAGPSRLLQLQLSVQLRAEGSEKRWRAAVLSVAAAGQWHPSAEACWQNPTAQPGRGACRCGKRCRPRPSAEQP